MVRSDDEPIKILGAGISGLSAAITLARNGLKVEVFEKNSHAGGRFKRDFQGLRNFGNLDIDSIKEFEKVGIYLKPCERLMKITRYSQFHSFEVFSDNKPIYYSVLRGENENSIDSQLVTIAAKLGVDIKFNSRLNLNYVDIVATGPYTRDSFAYGELYEDTNIDDSGFTFFDKRYSPNGYLYVIPGEKNGEAEVVNYSNNSSIDTETLKLLYNRAVRENDILKNILDGAIRKYACSGIGCCSLLDEPFQNNRYYVGEAAGLQDVTAGFGIRYAIMSGYLAAQSILTGKDYNQFISKTFKPQLEFEHKRRENFKKLTNKEIDKNFQLINEKFGYKITIEEYESMRGEI
jgi:flavin-dependent dehydrogenase